MLRLKSLITTLLTTLLVFMSPLSYAQSNKNPIIIRDTEIEHTFKGWITPLLKAAGLSPDSVNLILVQSPEVNAFVAGGANMFIYTGLIDKSENPEEIIGVLAHELGHITGGHLISTRDAMTRASYESILGTVLGIGAAIATGNGGAANAIISGSSNYAQRRFLAHSRVNESSAEQAALKYLETAKINPQGLESFMEKLESEELLPASQQSEYIRTHPITRDRIAALETKIKSSPYTGQPTPEIWTQEHARMKAKLLGFIDPGSVAWTYNDRDQSVPARYARSIAAFRNKNVEPAIKEIDALIAMEPENPYFQELKGQMLVSFGRVKESLPHYKKSVELAPQSGLIRIDLGRALLESNPDDAQIKEAIKILEIALHNEPRSSGAHRLLATAYGRLGKEDMAKLHLAEEAVLQRNLPYAKRQAEAALKNFAEGSPEALQAQDLLNHIENLERVKG